MIKIFEFIKKHWALLILVVIALKYFSVQTLNRVPGYSGSSFSNLSNLSVGSPKMMVQDSFMPPQPQYPPTESSNRLVITDTNLSLQVDNVSNIITQVENTASRLGGFMVNSNLSTPEGASSGSITVRVPSDRRAEALDTYRKMAVKVVYENISGSDVTDQFVDTQARLDVLIATKNKFEDILKSANNVSDLLNVQRELINLQSQIDSLKGQQQYLEKSAKLSLITLNLSTDDLSLPYTPDQAWRPAVIFKQAIRSLVSTARQLGTLLIWIAVYSPIILVGVGITWFLRKKAILK